MTDTILGFSSLGLPTSLLSAIEKIGFENPTPIQAQTIPALLEGQDVLGEAQTGTGKTAAFGLPLLARLDLSRRDVQMLVMAPTRELAIQVAEALESFGKELGKLNVATLYGGQAYGPQLKQLRSGAQVVVATPGRLMDHIRKGYVKLDNVSACVLDEADEMLNMGFLEDIQWILEHVPETAQMALFSATMPPAIRKVTQEFLKDPVHVRIEPEKKKVANITQRAWKVVGFNKTQALERLVETLDYDAMLVFVRTRADTVTLADHLNTLGFAAEALNGDMNQDQRERTVERLKKGKISIVIATDVVARGLDVPRISHVLNYDLPMETESYVHRIGRTGRAGRSGDAILFARPREMHLLKRYERATSGSIEMMQLPTAEELGKKRITQVQTQLGELCANQDLDKLRELVNQMATETELDVLDLAAALLHQHQGRRPLIPDADPEFRERRERRDRADRNDRPRREARGEGRRNRRDEDVNWQTYRIAVGRDHGAQPKDIVGAIANEVDLDSRYIGAIRLFDNHSTVQLPDGMPNEIFNHLKKVRVRSQALAIAVHSGGDREFDRPRGDRRPRGGNGNRGNREGGFRGRPERAARNGRQNDERRSSRNA